MEIVLTDAGRRFRLEWIFKGLSQRFQSGERYAVLGPNGSGKSTLLKVLSGHLSLTKGSIVFNRADGQPIPIENLYRQVAYAAPYIEHIEELTLTETLDFYARLKPWRAGLTAADVLELLELPRTRHKEIRYFSSGMKQRVKLACAICADAPLLLLDEPTTNLDAAAAQWYHNLLERYAANRLIVIASNDPADVASCGARIEMLRY
jgi:ABC-type multidrug transport system ATPase subunit